MRFSIKRKVITFIMSGVLGRIMQDVNTWVFRVSRGKVGSRLLGAPILLLTTTGRKSGLPRTIPLLYLDAGEEFVVIASNGGLPQHPLWYRNLQADSHVRVEVGGKATEMQATTASAEQRAAFWPRIVALYADYAAYQTWTEREFPLVVLTERTPT